MYVVTSPSLVAACDRRSKTVSFAPYVVDFARRILVTSQPGIDMLSEDLLEKNGPVGLRVETLKTIHNSLAPGESLDSMTRDTINHVAAFLDSPCSGIGDEKGLPLFEWIRQFFSIVSTDVLYGLDNPLKSPKLMKGFWAIDRDFALLGLNFLPNLIAPQASRGRRLFFSAFRNYYAEGGLEKASQLAKARYELNKRHGVSADDIAQFDLGVCIGLLVNSVPAIGWTLCYVYSEPRLLDQLRQGAESIISQHSDASKSCTRTVNIAQLIQDLPLLESTVKEVLRIQSNNASARFLLEDTTIKGDNGSVYLLKKDAFLVVPSAPIHAREDVWGPTAKNFDPTRFLRQQGRKEYVSGYRTFGGGNALCPGRHLAIHEIISTLTIMMLKYDVYPLNGRWEIPRTKHHFSTSILTPVKDIRVRIWPRIGTEKTAWKFVWEPENVRR